MAQIPVYKPQQRISAGSPIQLTSTSDARDMGEAVESTGKAIGNVGVAIAKYVEERQRTNDALFVANLKNDVEIEMKKAEMLSRNNPNAAPDGSTALTDFALYTSPLKEKIDGIQDNRQRGLAKKVFADTGSKVSQRLIEYSAEKYNDNIISAAEETTNGFAERASDSPEELVGILQEYDGFAANMPYTGENHNKFVKTGRRGIVTSAISGHESRGEYKEAFDLLDQTGALYNTKEKDQIKNRLVSHQIRDANFRWATEQRKKKDLVTARKNNIELVELELLSQSNRMDDPELKAELMKDIGDAKRTGVVSSSFVSAVMRQQNPEVVTQRTISTRSQFLEKHFAGESSEILRGQIWDAVANDQLSKTDAQSLVAVIRAENYKQNKDPRYKQEKSGANAYIKNAANPPGIMGKIMGQEGKDAFVEIQERAALLESQGLTPMDSAKQATAEILGPKALRVDGRIKSPQANDPKLLKEYGSNLLKRYDSLRGNGQMTFKTQKEIIIELAAIKQRLGYLDQQQILESVKGVPRQKKGQ